MGTWVSNTPICKKSKGIANTLKIPKVLLPLLPLLPLALGRAQFQHICLGAAEQFQHVLITGVLITFGQV